MHTGIERSRQSEEDIRQIYIGRHCLGRNIVYVGKRGICIVALDSIDGASDLISARCALFQTTRCWIKTLIWPVYSFKYSLKITWRLESCPGLSRCQYSGI